MAATATRLVYRRPHPAQVVTTVVVRKLAAEQRDRLHSNLDAARADADPEAIHAMRVALRRTRALLRAYHAYIEFRGIKTLRNDLRWLAGELAPARELDVMIARIDGYRRHSPKRLAVGFEPWRTSLDDQRVRAQERIAAALGSSRYTRLMRNLDSFTTRRSSPDEASFVEAARATVTDAWKRLRRAGKRIDESDEETLHRVRIRTKQLRYLIEFSAPLAGKAARHAVRELAAIQECLGIQRDSLALIEAADRYMEEGNTPVSRPVALALESLTAKERRTAHRAMVRFNSKWRRLRDKHGATAIAQVIQRLSDRAGEPDPRIVQAATATVESGLR